MILAAYVSIPVLFVVAFNLSKKQDLISAETRHIKFNEKKSVGEGKGRTFWLGRKTRRSDYKQSKVEILFEP